MLDFKYVCENIKEVERKLSLRGINYDLSPLFELNEKRKNVIQKHDFLRHNQREISELFRNKSKKPEELRELREELKKVGETIKILEEEQKKYAEEMKNFLLEIPNIPHETTPVGKDSNDNVEIRKVGEPSSFNFVPKEHWEIGEKLGILDFERSRKISGARFVVYKDEGAKLERALMNFMLDLHTEVHHYKEVLTPFIVSEETMIGTGQLPKFREEIFITEDNFYLIPTAEVPVTNLHRDEILDGRFLPLKYVAYSPCFRREAGSYGKDVRGIARLHQFQKVELVKFTTPETSDNELESLLMDAEEVLKRLEIHYRVVALCTGDLGFASSKCYDIEVWLPGQKCYKEVSSCSNFEDYQARRANIRFRQSAGEKPAFVHTLNGSGLAIGRTLMAILENYQREDGSVEIPIVLRNYMGGMRNIVPKS